MRDATKLSAKAFLQRHGAEYLPEHAKANKVPKDTVHEMVDPRKLTPTEWELSKIPAESRAKVDALSLRFKNTYAIPPVVVRSDLTLFDGHHRSAAALATGYKVPVVYDNISLARIWVQANKSTENPRQIADDYAASIR
jgi:ParB-like chromosome segregation protein Spo0J